MQKIMINNEEKILEKAATKIKTLLSFKDFVTSQWIIVEDSWETREKDIMAIIQAALHSQKERGVEMCEEMLADRNKAYRVAEAIGKEPTSRGPIAQARIDGFRVALSDLKTKIEEEL